jgi:2,4-dienoyl-CoA reductase-like NADH-dependent reductase (Old Yellow Enzyme family)
MKNRGLFDAVSINGMSLINRFVRSATWEGLADQEGAVTSELTERMVELAKGEVGLIITGYAFVHPEGRTSSRQTGAHDDRLLSGLAGMARSVHAAGGRIALQLVHGGAFADSGMTGCPAIGPSAGERNRAAAPEDIARIVSAFADAAGRVREAGFDAVQLHGAHGFLLSQFLSPALNRRTDDYGGSLANRARLLLKVVGKVREAVGPDYPVLVKLNSEDFLEGGMTREESLRIAGMLEAASVDAIELSGGTVASQEKFMAPRPGMLKTSEEEVYYREAAKGYKERVRIPLMLVGGIRSFEVAEELVREEVADFISLSRPLIREPDLVKRWREGDRRKAECISCNGCFAPAIEGRGLRCVIE